MIDSSPNVTKSADLRTNVTAYISNLKKFYNLSFSELCSQEFYGYSFMEANRFLHAHLMDALFRSRREPGQAKMAAQHLTCFNHNLVYAARAFCPACRIMRDSLDSTLHHVTQIASSTDMTAIQHMNVANEFVSKFIGKF